MCHRRPLLVALGALLAVVVSVGPADAAKKKRHPHPRTAKKTAVNKEKKEKKEKKKEAAPPFDREAAVGALSSVDLTKCRATNAQPGDGHVTITFTPAGGVSVVTVDRGPWIGTPVAKCLSGQFKKAKIPVFGGEAVTVGKNFRFE